MSLHPKPTTMSKLKYTLPILIMMMATASSSVAQWTQIGYMISNTSDTVTGNQTHNNILGFSDKVYCCTDSGLFVSSNNGDTWVNSTNGVAEVDNEKVYSFFISSSSDKYLGSSRRLYKMAYNTSNWIWLNTLPDNLTYNEIDEIGGNIVVSYQISYTNGGAYYSPNGGTSWTLATGLPDVPMFYMQKAGTKLYLAGRDGVYASTDNGQSWALSGTGFPSGCRYWDIVESGGTIFAGEINGNGMYASYDQGATWINPYPTVFTGFCQIFAITNSDDMILASMDGSVCSSGGTGIKMSNDNGQTWNTFMTGLETGFHPVLGKNSAGTSFFTKQGSNKKKVYRYDLVTGMEKANNRLNYTCYPNPVSHMVIIETELTKGNYLLRDITGKTLLQGTVNAPKFTLDLSNLSSGVYFITVADSEKQVVGKVVKE